MQLNGPLSPALSPSEGEREKAPRVSARSLNGERSEPERKSSLSPSEGERAGERGPFNCMVTTSVRSNVETLSVGFSRGLRNLGCCGLKSALLFGVEVFTPFQAGCFA